MNRRPPFDGTEPALDADGRGTTEIVAESNPRARWAKSFSNLGYHDLEDDPRTSGAADRRAIVVIGDGSQAAAVVCRPHRPTRSTPSPTGR